MMPSLHGRARLSDPARARGRVARSPRRLDRRGNRGDHREPFLDILLHKPATKPAAPNLAGGAGGCSALIRERGRALARSQPCEPGEHKIDRACSRRRADCCGPGASRRGLATSKAPAAMSDDLARVGMRANVLGPKAGPLCCMWRGRDVARRSPSRPNLTAVRASRRSGVGACT